MALRKVLAKLGIEVSGTEKIDKADSALSDFVANARAASKALIGGAILGQIKAFTSGLLDQGRALSIQARDTASSTAGLQAWQYAAEASRVEVSDLSGALTSLRQNIVTASRAGMQGATGGTGGFARLGVAFRDTKGQIRDTTDVLSDTIGQLSKVRNPALRDQMALQLLGASAAKLKPFMNQGANGVKALLSEFKDFGGGYTNEALESMRDAERATLKWDVATKTLRSAFASSLMPALAKVITTAAKLMVGFKHLTEGTNTMKAVLVVLGAVGAKALWSIVAPYSILAVKAALAVLLVDELITLFSGGETVIGKFSHKLVEAIFDKATADKAKADWKDWIASIKAAASKGNEYGSGIVGGITEAFSGLGATLVRFVLDDLPAFWNAIDGWLTDKVGWLGDRVIRFFVDGFAWIVGAVSSVAGTIGSALSSAWSTALDILKATIGPRATNAALDFVRGIVAGIKSGASWVVDAVSGLGQQAIDAFKDKFKIRSPSAVMADMTESGVVAGAVKGIDAGIPDLAKAAGRMSQAFLRPSFGGVSGGSRSMDQRNTIQVNVSGAGSSGSDLAASVRAGISGALSDEREAALAALEATV